MIRNLYELLAELWQAFIVRACPCDEHEAVDRG